MAKIISAVLLILVLVGVVALVVIYFQTSPKVKVLTINSSGKFEKNELKIKNDETLKIQNKDDRKHTIRNLGTNTNIVTDLDKGKTSKELVFDDNSRNELALADDNSVKTAILVGNAPKATVVEQTPSTVTPPTTTTPPEAPNGQTSSPLPTTGASDNYLYLALLGLGLAIFLATRRLFPASFRKYLAFAGNDKLLVRQRETTIVRFPKN